MSPKLLVSVLSAQEAQIAGEHCVPIVDIKDPRQGSLGMASNEVLFACEQTVRRLPSPSLLSAACGEVGDWELRCEDPYPKLPQFDYLKLGFAGLIDQNDWQNRWQIVRSRIEMLLPLPQSVKWIAVAYVDVPRAHSPDIQEVIEAAARTGCQGVLFDTFDKRQFRFFDWLDEPALQRYLSEIHAAGMFCSVAGRLTFRDVARLAALPVDVVAVRSAACEQGNRTNQLSGARIQQLQKLLAQEIHFD